MRHIKSLRRSLAMLIALMMLASTLMVTPVLAKEDDVEEKSAQLIAAETLHKLGLFLGYGDDEDGNPVFGLEDGATRLHGIIMLLRFLGEYGKTQEGDNDCPFVDVTGEYNRAIVGYAFAMGYTKGVSAARFDPTGALTATMYLTFILRALGYEDGVDFEWDAAWELTDELGITNGEYSANNNSLLRGQMVLISLLALQQQIKGSEQTLLESLNKAGVFDSLELDADEIAALVDEAVKSITKPDDKPEEPAVPLTPAPTGVVVNSDRNTPPSVYITGVTISGEPVADATLTATLAVSGVPNPAVTYQWQISDDGETGWTNIAGATSATYVIKSTDEGKHIRATVSQTGAPGSPFQSNVVYVYDDAYEASEFEYVFVLGDYAWGDDGFEVEVIIKGEFDIIVVSTEALARSLIAKAGILLTSVTVSSTGALTIGDPVDWDAEKTIVNHGGLLSLDGGAYMEVAFDAKVYTITFPEGIPPDATSAIDDADGLDFDLAKQNAKAYITTNKDGEVDAIYIIVVVYDPIPTIEKTHVCNAFITSATTVTAGLYQPVPVTYPVTYIDFSIIISVEGIRTPLLGVAGTSPAPGEFAVSGVSGDNVYIVLGNTLNDGDEFIITGSKNSAFIKHIGWCYDMRYETPPIISNIVMTRVAEDSAQFRFTSDRYEFINYIVVAAGTPAPNAAQVISIAQGDGNAGYSQNVVDFCFSVTYSWLENITWLDLGGAANYGDAFTLYYVETDRQGNKADVSAVDIGTVAEIPFASGLYAEAGLPEYKVENANKTALTIHGQIENPTSSSLYITNNQQSIARIKVGEDLTGVLSSDYTLLTPLKIEYEDYWTIINTYPIEKASGSYMIVQVDTEGKVLHSGIVWIWDENILNVLAFNGLSGMTIKSYSEYKGWSVENLVAPITDDNGMLFFPSYVTSEEFNGILVLYTEEKGELTQDAEGYEYYSAPTTGYTAEIAYDDLDWINGMATAPPLVWYSLDYKLERNTTYIAEQSLGWGVRLTTPDTFDLNVRNSILLDWETNNPVDPGYPESRLWGLQSSIDHILYIVDGVVGSRILFTTVDAPDFQTAVPKIEIKDDITFFYGVYANMILEAEDITVTINPGAYASINSIRLVNNSYYHYDNSQNGNIGNPPPSPPSVVGDEEKPPMPPPTGGGGTGGETGGGLGPLPSIGGVPMQVRYANGMLVVNNLAFAASVPNSIDVELTPQNFRVLIDENGSTIDVSRLSDGDKIDLLVRDGLTVRFDTGEGMTATSGIDGAITVGSQDAGLIYSTDFYLALIASDPPDRYFVLTTPPEDEAVLYGVQFSITDWQ